VNRWPVTVELPVQWGDMDSFAHVNNVVYLRWFESARIAYFERAGILERMATERVGPILARQTIDYRLPLQYPDTLRVATTVIKLGKTSFTMGLRMRSRAQGRAIAAEGESVVVMMDYRAGRKVQLWEELRRRIEELEASAPETPPWDTDA
jgi:acyl-CoA thioester hydrolase